MLDVAEQHGISIDSQKLSEQLGLQVVSMVAARKKGIQELKAAMLAAGDSSRVAHPSGESESNAAAAGDVDPLLRRYHRSKQLKRCGRGGSRKTRLSEKLDRVVLNRWLGVPIFLLMIYLCSLSRLISAQSLSISLTSFSLPCWLMERLDAQQFPHRHCS